MNLSFLGILIEEGFLASLGMTIVNCQMFFDLVRYNGAPCKDAMN